MKGYLLSGICLLLAAAACLFLPDAAVKRQDSARLGRAETESASEVVLKEQTSMSLLEEISFMNSDTTTLVVSLLSNGKNYKQETILEQVKQEVEKLIELGAVEDFDTSEMSLEWVETCLGIDTVDCEKTVILWRGGATTLETYVDFLLDDETGKLLGFTLTKPYTEVREKTQNSVALVVTDKAADKLMDKMDKETQEAQNNALENQYAEELRILSEKWAQYLGCEAGDREDLEKTDAADATNEMYWIREDENTQILYDFGVGNMVYAEPYIMNKF